MENNEEVWYNIPGFEGAYQFSSFCRIKSLQRVIIRNNGKPYSIKETILKLKIDTNGYYYVGLRKNGKIINKMIHRLVEYFFIPNPNNLPQLNHKDGNKKNYQINNLEWCTGSQNQKHANDTGLKINKSGEESPNFKGVIWVYKNRELVDKLYGVKDMERKGYAHAEVYDCVNGKRKIYLGCTFIRVNK